MDEIHRTPKTVEEFLYPAMEDFKVDFVVDKGAFAKVINVPLKRFTLVGATTRAGSAPPATGRYGPAGMPPPVVNRHSWAPVAASMQGVLLEGNQIVASERKKQATFAELYRSEIEAGTGPA